MLTAININYQYIYSYIMVKNKSRVPRPSQKIVYK